MIVRAGVMNPIGRPDAPGASAVLARAVGVGARTAWHAGRCAARLAWSRLTGRGATAPERVGAALATLFEDLGGGFLKLGQLLGTRGDLFPESMLIPLRRLLDDVAPLPPDRVRAVLSASLASAEQAFAEFDPLPLASGSIAQVHRARLRGSDQWVAVKVRRPGIARWMSIDCRLVEAISGVLAHLPWFRRLPVREAVGQVLRVMIAQTDFTAELDHLRRYRGLCGGREGVRIPRPIESLCTADVITMEFCPNRGRVTDRAIDPAARRAVVQKTLRAAYRSIFVDGFFHCDLHPGNVLVAPDGSPVVLDAGYMGEFAPGQRRAFAEFFLSIARRDARTAARVVRQVALHVPERIDPARLEADLADLLRTCAGRTAGQFQIARFVTELFRVQAAHRIRGSPHFTLAILALLTFEGTVKAIDPDLDFQREAVPSLLIGLSRD
jgi:ubiquinone biosynthesis protein